MATTEGMSEDSRLDKDEPRTDCLAWGGVSCLLKTTPALQTNCTTILPCTQQQEAAPSWCCVQDLLSQTRSHSAGPVDSEREGVCYLFTPVSLHWQPSGANSTEDLVVTLRVPVVFVGRYGKIVSTKAILDKTTNKCKGEALLQLVHGTNAFDISSLNINALC